MNFLLLLLIFEFLIVHIVFKIFRKLQMFFIQANFLFKNIFLVVIFTAVIHFTLFIVLVLCYL